MTVTDIVTVPVKPGTNVLDVDTPEAEAFAESWRILGRQVGFVEAWYGYKIENPNELQLFINWKSIEEHVTFRDSDDHDALIKSLSIMLAGKPSSYHVEFQVAEAQKIAFRAPITEIAEAYVQDKTAELSQNASKLFESVARDSDGFVGATTGWSVEDVEHEKLDGKGKLFTLAVGWKSVDAHMNARNTEGFKASIGGIRKHIKSMAAYHVTTRYVK